MKVQHREEEHGLVDGGRGGLKMYQSFDVIPATPWKEGGRGWLELNWVGA